jgi:hypothetical protein
MEIVIRFSHYTKRGPVYDALLNGSLLCSSRTPFLEGARVLLSQGYPPGRVIRMRHEESMHWSLQAPIGKAAKLAVRDDRSSGPTFRVYEAMDKGDSRSMAA